MTRRLAIAALVAWALAAGTARAQTAFGGDDTGFIPPDDPNLGYETKVAKHLARYQKCQLKCHEKRAKGKLPDSTIEEDCEAGCTTKYNAANTKLLPAPAPAASCLNTDSVRGTWHGIGGASKVTGNEWPLVTDIACDLTRPVLRRRPAMVRHREFGQVSARMAQPELHISKQSQLWEARARTHSCRNLW